MLGIQFPYITCYYVRQASGKLSGCQEQPLFERYAYNFNTLPKRSIVRFEDMFFLYGVNVYIYDSLVMFVICFVYVVKH